MFWRGVLLGPSLQSWMDSAIQEPQRDNNKLLIVSWRNAKSFVWILSLEAAIIIISCRIQRKENKLAIFDRKYTAIVFYSLPYLLNFKIIFFLSDKVMNCCREYQKLWSKRTSLIWDHTPYSSIMSCTFPHRFWAH